MRFSLGETRGWIALLAFTLGVGAWAQESSPSLGDVARQTRKKHLAAGHAVTKQIASEEEDGPDSSGIWRVRLCSRTPCYELSITLPKSPKWSRPASEPRPVLIPLLDYEEDSSHAIRVYAAESLGPPYPSIDVAKRIFLQGWFARPEYFGQGARLVLDEHVSIDGYQSLMTHFTLTGGGLKYRGLSVVASSANGNYGFACVFREEDSSAASSVCDAIVKSARNQVLEPAKPRVYPMYQDPPQYYPRYDEPRDDPPQDDNPE